MFGHHGGSAFASTPQSSPWDNSAAGSDLARDAGVGDIGNTRQGAFDDQQPSGLLDDTNDNAGFGDDPTGGSDFGDLGGDDSA